jgi:hypothetical protein
VRVCGLVEVLMVGRMSEVMKKDWFCASVLCG